MRERLAEYFDSVAWKILSGVEASPQISNQHEFNGVGELRKIFGSEKKSFSARFFYLTDDEEQGMSNDGYLTWYDARENHPVRSEYRLYYSDGEVMNRARKNDSLFIAVRSGDRKSDEYQVAVIVASHDSTSERQLAWLFGADLTCRQKFETHDSSTFSPKEIGYAIRELLEQLGIIIDLTDSGFLTLLIEKFGGTGFPGTAIFSNFARESLPRDSRADPDEALIAWIRHEQILFETYEKYLFEKRITQGFIDIEEFLAFSLSIHNRRKSRAGLALEHHLEQIFKDHCVRYTRAATTERKSRPDFLFPGVDSYHEREFPENRLTMLGVKSTCKDRWRQVLSEADRITHKHLFTLETSISTSQTDEMQAHNLQLVIPTSLIPTYSLQQTGWLMTIADFLEFVLDRQRI